MRFIIGTTLKPVLQRPVGPRSVTAHNNSRSAHRGPFGPGEWTLYNIRPKWVEQKLILYYQFRNAEGEIHEKEFDSSEEADKFIAPYAS